MLVNYLLTSFYAKHQNPNYLTNAFADDMCLVESVKYDDIPRMEKCVKDVHD